MTEEREARIRQLLASARGRRPRDPPRALVAMVRRYVPDVDIISILRIAEREFALPERKRTG
jgi:hypothetical protein